MAPRFAVLVFVSAVNLTAGAYGQNSLDGRPPGPLDYAPVTLHVACGELFNAACGKVLPRIATRTAGAGIELKPVESGGMLDTAAAVCQGQAAAAIVQRDVLVRIGRQPPCFGRYDVVGHGLYPYYALLIVKAATSFRSFDDLASGGHRTIAAGADGSGGQIALGDLLGSNPAWQRAITVTNDDATAALQGIEDGTIDGLFAMETLDSDLLDRVRVMPDGHGKPRYRFIDVRPGQAFSRIGDGSGNCVYRVTALDFGGPAPVTTVSVDAVMILGRGFHDSHARGGPRAPDALAAAIDATRGAILTDMKSPTDWRPAGTSCQ